VWQINEKYLAPATPQFRPPTPFTILAQKQLTILNNCSADERLTVINSLSPDIRRAVLGTIGPQSLEGLPEDLKQEAANLRKASQEEFQNELRKRNPRLTDILTKAQIDIANRG